MQTRTLGRPGLTVSALGLGCMGMSWAYGHRDEAEARRTLVEAVELGITLFDTAEVYGPFTNERLVGEVLRPFRERIVIATKFGFKIDAEGKPTGADSRPEHIRAVVDASLQRLGTSYIDLLYQHRVDPAVPIEDVVGVMAELVRAGKVRYLGLSEASAATLRRAAKVHPITALQSEYSLFERNVEAEILPTCRELGIGLVAYSPLGRGMLTGQVKRAEEYGTDDNRRLFPRFQGENFQHNMALAAKLAILAARKHATPGQLALAWLLAQGPDIVPIPGTTRRQHLRENVGVAEVTLTTEDLAWLNAQVPATAVAGPRYHDGAMRLIDR